ncbi:hypothetical protein NQ318_001769 [Aromia moschata]|uniref:MADF domain-containing protein n=1 Tax=Aromia moschata TaxID=1265417 RepID=A0AAV8Y4S4_9CUCU|nr:hypothetical protein NQ318_001769 [Aromia moschata]
MKKTKDSKNGRAGRVIECKTRWRSLRDLYHRKKKDRKKGKRARCQWEYMESLSFLDDFTTERKLDANPDDSSEEKDEDNSASKSTEQFPQGNYMNLIAVPFNLNESQITNLKRSATEDAISETGGKKVKSEPVEAEDEVREENETVQLLREIRDATRAKRHPIRTFFDSMANTVMSFPPALAAEAKLKVCQIVTELECRMLDEAELADVESNMAF